MKTENWDNGGFRINDETIPILALVVWARSEAIIKEVWKWHEKRIDNQFVHLIGKIDKDVKVNIDTNLAIQSRIESVIEDDYCLS